jgi:hypothetical protein
MTDKNVIYLYDVCGLSLEAISAQSGYSLERVRAIVSKPPVHTLACTPRNRYNEWVNGK